MKRWILFVSWVSVIAPAFAPICASEIRVVTPADRRASPDVVKLLTYISSLAKRSEKRVLSGQHCGRGVEVAEQYRADVTEVAAATGHKIALIGTDYGDDLEMKWYEDVSSMGKPFGLDEVGPKRDSRGSFDYSRWTRAIRARYPATCYFQAWCWDWAMAANKNAKELLTSPLIAGRDDLDWRGQS